MSSVLNPVGPEEPGTYWRRRLLVGLGVLVVLIVLFVLLRSCSSDPAPTAAPASPSASPTPSATSSSSTSVNSTSTAVSGTLCADSDIEVSVAPDKGTSFPTGTPITFTMSIKNVSDKACDRNVGTKPNTVTVSSGDTQVWSSDDCAPAGADDVKTIQPGDIYQLNANWDQKQSKPGCPSGQPTAKAGSYDVVGINDQVKSKPVTFSIT